MAKEVTKKTFEEKMKRLEEVVAKIESSEVELEESIKLFEEGVKLSKECQSSLDQAEKKVKILMSDGEVRDFEQ